MLDNLSEQEQQDCNAKLTQQINEYIGSQYMNTIIGKISGAGVIDEDKRDSKFSGDSKDKEKFIPYYPMINPNNNNPSHRIEVDQKREEFLNLLLNKSKDDSKLRDYYLECIKSDTVNRLITAEATYDAVKHTREERDILAQETYATLRDQPSNDKMMQPFREYEELNGLLTGALSGAANLLVAAKKDEKAGESLGTVLPTVEMSIQILDKAIEEAKKKQPTPPSPSSHHN